MSVAESDPSRQPHPDPIPGVFTFGSLCVFGGAPRSGKTTLLSQWIECWREGSPILGYPTSQTQVYYLASDRPWSNYTHFFNGYTPPHFALADHPDIGLKSPGEVLFSNCLKRLAPQPGSLVIVDPFAPLFLNGNQNSGRDVARTLHYVRKVQAGYHVSLLLVVHFHKQRRRQEEVIRPIDRISGSGIFSGFSDVQMYLMDEDEQEPGYQLLGWNPPHQPPEEFRIARNKQGLFELYDGLSEEGTRPENDRPTQLLALVPEGEEGIDRDELLELFTQHFNLKRPSFERDIATLKKRGLLEQHGRGRYRRRKLQ